MAKTVCIYFSDTGGGHRSAADAVEAGIRELLQRCGENQDVKIIKDPIAERSHPINRRFVELYNYLLRHHQPLMKYYYWLLHFLRPEAGANYNLTANFLQSTLKEQAPDVVVSVHPMVNHCIARSMQLTGMSPKVKLVSVITDPNADLWRAWACNDVDYFAAPNDVVKEKLIEWGVEADKIEITGMAVNPIFLKPPKTNRNEFLTSLGLSPDAVTICINAGWAGGGNMLNIYKALASVKRPVQVIFICGHNPKLYEKAMTAAAESDLPTAVLPLHDSMSDLMGSVDLMITKAGGLTTFEAVARRLPLAFDMITEPMPQEKGTVEMMLAQRMAKAVAAPEDIIDIVQNFTPVRDRRSVQLPSTHNYDLTDFGVYTIAERVLNMIGITVPEAEVISLDKEQEPFYVKVS